MAYDEDMAERVRATLADRLDVSERKMFGGLCFMVNGHMCCGITQDDLMLRLGEEGASAALEEPHTRPMDFTGRPMKTMVFVDRDGVRSERALRAWVDRAVDFAVSLPPK